MKKSILLFTLVAVSFSAFGMESADNQHSNNEEVQTSRVPMLRNLCIEKLVQMEPDWEQFLDDPHYADDLALRNKQIKKELALAFAKEQKDLNCWLLSKLKKKPQMFNHPNYVDSAVYNNECTQMLTSCSDNNVRVWDVKTGECLQTCKHPDLVYSAIYNNDCTQILTRSCWDGNVRVWDIKTGECIQTCKHPDWVYSAIYNSDCTQILTNCSDGNMRVNVRIWDIKTGECIQTCKHPDDVGSAVYNNECTQMLTSCEDGNVRVWDLLATRKLTLEQLFLVMYLFEYYRKDSADHETLELSCANSPHLIPVFRSLDKKMQNIFKVLILSDEIVAPQEDETYMNTGGYLEGCVLQ